MANKGENGNHRIVLSLPLWGILHGPTRHPLPQGTKRDYAFSKYIKLSFAVRPRTNLVKGKQMQAGLEQKGGNSNGKVGQKGSTQPLPPYHCASARFPQLVFTSIVKLLTGTDHVIFF